MLVNENFYIYIHPRKILMTEFDSELIGRFSKLCYESAEDLNKVIKVFILFLFYLSPRA